MALGDVHRLGVALPLLAFEVERPDIDVVPWSLTLMAIGVPNRVIVDHRSRRCR